MKVIKDERIPIKMWLDEIEPGAEQQARNIAKLPFVFHHIAIMPDAHVGYGMPIGGVMATKGYIVPNAVGVDIGCFTGETKIPLLNGIQQTLKDLSRRKDKFWIYSINENKKIVPGRARCIKTRKKAKLVKVVISGGEEIICTPDHQILLRNGIYKEAKDLKPKDSLMPFYRTYQTRDGYESLLNPSGKAVTTHKMVANYFWGKIKKGYVVHHKNDNQYDNRPENLEIISANEHSKIYSKKLVERFKSEEFKENRLIKLREKGFYNKKYRVRKAEIARKNIVSFMQNNSEKFQEITKESGKRGKKYLIIYNKSDKGRSKSKEIANRIYRCDICGVSVRGPIGLYNHKRKQHKNHKVIKVITLKRKADVYCLNVEKYHNFALAAGIFVHNCGMCAVRTNLKEVTEEKLKEVLGNIRERLPTGFDHHKTSQESETDFDFKSAPDVSIIQQELASAKKQIGTLGGGNHFVDIHKGDDGYIWLMTHSGSRNFGYKAAGTYHRKAKEYIERKKINIPDMDLAYLPIKSKKAQEYLQAMDYCQKFAQANRDLIIKRVRESIKQIFSDVEFEPPINIHHNYASFEKHFGEEVIVHRKGATAAFKGQIGVVPGSMGTNSYIVEGLGNPESFCSCAHGAGRKLGRKEAKRIITEKEANKAIEGVVLGRWYGRFDEAPQAYKDIEEIMKQQKDLVKIKVRLRPIAVVIG